MRSEDIKWIAGLTAAVMNAIPLNPGRLAASGEAKLQFGSTQSHLDTEHYSIDHQAEERNRRVHETMHD